MKNHISRDTVTGTKNKDSFLKSIWHLINPKPIEPMIVKEAIQCPKKS